MKRLAPLEKESNIHDSVLDFLKKNAKGSTTTEIAKQTKVSRKTLEKHLQLLTSENEIYMKTFGPTRVYYPNNRMHYLDFEKLNINNKTFWFDIMKNEYGLFLLIQEKRRDKSGWKTQGSVLIPLDKIKFFVSTLLKILKSKKLKKLNSK